MEYSNWVKKNLSAPSNVLQHHRRHAARPQRHPQLLSAQWPRVVCPTTSQSDTSIAPTDSSDQHAGKVRIDAALPAAVRCSDQTFDGNEEIDARDVLEGGITICEGQGEGIPDPLSTSVWLARRSARLGSSFLTLSDWSCASCSLRRDLIRGVEEGAAK